MEREKRTEMINMKVLPSIKEKVKTMAEEENRTMSNLIEKLIEEEWKRRKGE